MGIGTVEDASGPPLTENSANWDSNASTTTTTATAAAAAAAAASASALLSVPPLAMRGYVVDKDVLSISRETPW